MNKQQVIDLFELNYLFEKYKANKAFASAETDRLTGTENAIYYFCEKENLKISVHSTEFGASTQELEMSLTLSSNVVLNKDEVFKNEFFPFLKFEDSIDADLTFLSDYINKILRPKYHLIGSIRGY